MELGLEDKVFLVAAASKGLGYAIAHTLAEEGAKVWIGSRTEEDICRAAESITAVTGSEARAFVLDMKDADSIAQWVAGSLDYFGRIDGIVVNAGGPPPGKFEDFDDRQWHEAFELTLMSAVRFIREALEALKKSKGSILTLTSISVKEPVDNLILSNVMRTGVTGLVKTVSKEFAPYGIRVNNLMPGFFATDRLKNLDTNAANEQGIRMEDIASKRKSSVPLGRYGDPREFGKAAAFLLSEASAYTSGQSILLDGGVMKSLM